MAKNNKLLVLGIELDFLQKNLVYDHRETEQLLKSKLNANSFGEQLDFYGAHGGDTMVISTPYKRITHNSIDPKLICSILVPDQNEPGTVIDTYLVNCKRKLTVYNFTLETSFPDHLMIISFPYSFN